MKIIKYIFSFSLYRFLFLKLKLSFDQYVLVTQLKATSPSSRIDPDIKLSGVKNIKVAERCKIDKHCYLNAGSSGKQGEINIESEVIVGHGSMLYAGGGGISIGYRSRVGIGCVITAMHEDPYQDPDVSPDNHQHVFEQVKIGKYCLIAGGAIILGGSELGDYCIVGAGAVVKGKYPSHTTLVGNPARAVPRLGFEKK